MKMKSSYAVAAVILFACIIQMGTAKVLSKAREEEDTRAERTRRLSMRTFTGLCSNTIPTSCNPNMWLFECKFNSGTFNVKLTQHTGPVVPDDCANTLFSRTICCQPKCPGSK